MRGAPNDFLKRINLLETELKTKIENLWVIVTDFNLNMCRNLSFKHPDFS